MPIMWPYKGSVGIEGPPVTEILVLARDWIDLSGIDYFYQGNTVTVINPESQTVTTDIILNSGGVGDESNAITSGANGVAYIAAISATGPWYLYTVSTINNSYTGQIALGGSFQAGVTVVDPAGQYLYMGGTSIIGGTGASTYAVYDITTASIVATVALPDTTLPSGTFPVDIWSMATSADGTEVYALGVLVSCQGQTNWGVYWFDATYYYAAAVYIIGSPTNAAHPNEVIGIVPVFGFVVTSPNTFYTGGQPFPQPHPGAMNVDPEGNIWVAAYSGIVYVINPTTLKVVRQIGSTNVSLPFYVFADSLGEYFYIYDPGTFGITQFSAATRRAIATVTGPWQASTTEIQVTTVGFGAQNSGRALSCQGARITPDGAHLVFCNAGGGGASSSLTIVSTDPLTVVATVLLSGFAGGYGGSAGTIAVTNEYVYVGVSQQQINVYSMDGGLAATIAPPTISPFGDSVVFEGGLVTAPNQEYVYAQCSLNVSYDTSFFITQISTASNTVHSWTGWVGSIYTTPVFMTVTPDSNYVIFSTQGAVTVTADSNYIVFGWAQSAWIFSTSTMGLVHSLAYSSGDYLVVQIPGATPFSEVADGPMISQPIQMIPSPDGAYVYCDNGQVIELSIIAGPSASIPFAWGGDSSLAAMNPEGTILYTWQEAFDIPNSLGATPVSIQYDWGLGPGAPMGLPVAVNFEPGGAYGGIASYNDAVILFSLTSPPTNDYGTYVLSSSLPGPPAGIVFYQNPTSLDYFAYVPVTTSGTCAIITIPGGSVTELTLPTPLASCFPIDVALVLAASNGTNPPPTSSSPIANAGANQTVGQDVTVTLNGSGSYDPNHLAITYAWTQIAGPSVTLSSSTIVDPTFTSPSENTTITFQLIVNNGTLSSTPSDVIITVSSSPPPASTSIAVPQWIINALNTMGTAGLNGIDPSIMIVICLAESSGEVDGSGNPIQPFDVNSSDFGGYFGLGGPNAGSPPGADASGLSDAQLETNSLASLQAQAPIASGDFASAMTRAGTNNNWDAEDHYQGNTNGDYTSEGVVDFQTYGIPQNPAGPYPNLVSSIPNSNTPPS